MHDLYDTDILEWSEHQADALRRVAANDRLNSGSPDWPNIIEEIECVGRDQLRAVENLLVQALLHMLKSEAWPSSTAAPGWRAEAIRFRGDAARRYSPSMRQRLDIAKLYKWALQAMPETIDDTAPLSVPTTSAFTLDDLLAEAP